MDETKERDARGRKPAAARGGRPARRSRTEEGLVKKSIVLPPKIAAAAEELATTEGISLSALMTRAVEELFARLRAELKARAAVAEPVAEVEAESGPIPEEHYARATAFLEDLEDHYAEGDEAAE
jgi:hypothetical protein